MFLWDLSRNTILHHHKKTESNSQQAKLRQSMHIKFLYVVSCDGRVHHRLNRVDKIQRIV